MRLRKSDQGRLGIDIDARAVRLLELRQGRSGIRLAGHACVALEHDAVLDQRIQRPDIVAEALVEARRQAAGKTLAACVAVPAGAVIVRTLSLPAWFNEDEMHACLQRDIDDVLPFPQGEVAFDFQPLPSRCTRSSKRKVLMVGCRRLEVDQRVEVLHRAGLAAEAVEVETFALERVVTSLIRTAACAVVACEALVQVARDGGVLHVLREGRIIHRQDIVAEGGGGGVEHDAGGWVSRLARALQLYHVAAASGDGQEVSRLWLYGEGCQAPGLIDELTRETDLPVAVLAPLLDLPQSADVDVQALAAEAPALLLAYGLAMKGWA